MTRKYRNDGTIKILVILGGIVGLIGGVLRVNASWSLGNVYAICAIILAVLTFLSVLKPDKPIPYNGIIFLIFGIIFIILLLLWEGIIAGILLIVAAVLCFAD